jgi:hypothetical protein
MDWKQHVLLWFNRAAQFWLMQTILIYLWASVVANRPISPQDYVRFSYHVIQWRPGQMLTTPAYLRQR